MRGWLAQRLVDVELQKDIFATWDDWLRKVYIPYLNMIANTPEDTTVYIMRHEVRREGLKRSIHS